MTTKTCTKCGETKDVSEYYIKDNIPQQPCKVCHAMKRWLRYNPDKAEIDYQYNPNKNKPQPVENGKMRCTKCNETKPVEKFYCRSSGKYDQPCKDCHVSKVRQYRKDLKEGKRIAKTLTVEEPTVSKREIQKLNLMKQMIQHAKKSSHGCNISLEHISIPDHCPALGVPLDLTCVDLQRRPEIDRIDNSKGYLIGNVVVVSGRVNQIKRSKSLQQMNNLRIILEASPRLSREDTEKKKIFEYYSNAFYKDSALNKQWIESIKEIVGDII